MVAKRPFNDLAWLTTPEPVRAYIIALEQALLNQQRQLDKLELRTSTLESRANQNSQNSSKPPSSDSPFDKPKKRRKKSKRKRGGQKGHKGHQQQILAPSKTKKLIPDQCDCGKLVLDRQSVTPYYTHQHIELPEIKMDVTHFVLHKGRCQRCGNTVTAQIPKRFQTGYGPRLSAVITELSGSHGASRQTVKEFCRSVLGLSISIGGIQRVIDRGSSAIKPIYREIGATARRVAVNGVDETSWLMGGKLMWLWTMVNDLTAFFMIHPNRSKAAFEQLIADWQGILISDNYGLYVSWVKRQTCLAHLIRKAKALCENNDEGIRNFGENILSELRRLCHWAKKPPDDKQWTDFYSRLLLLLMLHEGADDPAGQLAREIVRHLESLWLFLEEQGVEPTNNRSERALRFAVIWRKRSYGTQSEKGNRWVERILSLKQTCRMKNKPVFPILVNAFDTYFKDQSPDLDWITADC
jgi:transposase